MALKLLMNLEKNAFYIVILSILGIIWYMSFWGIFEELVDYIHNKYRISKRVIYLSVISVILVIILIHPAILDIL